MTQDELLALIDQAAAEDWKELDLSGQGLTELPPEIGKLTQLETLILGKVKKWVWMNGDFLLPTLETNQLTKLPVELKNLQNLRRLHLGGNPLEAIPAIVFELKQLNSLSLVSTGLADIPYSLTQLSNLTQLDLNSNQISQIPEVIGQLSNLTKLFLSGNQINQISEVIGQLSNLKVLSLDNNQISQIPEVIGQLSNLTELFLGGNQINQVSEVIGQLSNLTELFLFSNQISQIPEVIGQLSNLTRLYLFSNQISQIPEVIGQLSNLTELSLNINQINQVSEVIGQLSNLTELYLSDNQISRIPECLEALPNLKVLDLERNPLPISPEVLETREAEAIFDYCRQLRSGKVRPLNEVKMLLVGQGSVGKTSLINRLLHERFDRHEAQTDGLNVTYWPIHVNSKDVRVNVWDFGGQEIYHATHQFFLTKRSLYILVVNCRTSEDENRIEYWLKLIETFGDQSPVIIVGNKCDEQPLDINRRALRDKYPNIQAILETSCADNTGIEELRTAIFEQIRQLKEVYDLLPLSWFEVKQHLEHLNEDCISYAKYVGICCKYDITEEKDQERLITLLHNLGLVLNFRDHPILQNNAVLKPDWVTTGIYALLSDDDLKTVSKGILTPAHLSRILDPERYPANRHYYLTELMQEFQLCFPLEEPATFLIPGLLPKEEPETHLEGETLEFQYHYRILPDSVISRFIVLMHQKIYDHTYWRSGVMLVYRDGNEQNLARIKADPADHKIFISINGRASTRRSFLLIIRNEFERIHRAFANLEVSEWVPVPDHPNHPPLDYQELIGLEAMGEREHAIGKLRIKVNLRQLLDGYEPIELRQMRRLGDRDEMRFEYHYHYGDVIRGDKVGQDKVGNDKVGSDKIGRDKIEN
jgi:internalin A